MKPLSRRALFGLALAAPVAAVVPAPTCGRAKALTYDEAIRSGWLPVDAVRKLEGAPALAPHWIVTGDQQKARLKRWMLDDDDPLSFEEMLDEIGAEFVAGGAT